MAKWHKVISQQKSSNLKTDKFINFLEKVKNKTYSEKPSDLHSIITKKTLDMILKNNLLQKNCKVLDVGCGQGVALEIFMTLLINLIFEKGVKIKSYNIKYL